MSRLVDLFDAQKGLLQFIDIFDIGSLLKIELAEKGICSLLASWDITLPLKKAKVIFETLCPVPQKKIMRILGTAIL